MEQCILREGTDRVDTDDLGVHIMCRLWSSHEGEVRYVQHEREIPRQVQRRCVYARVLGECIRARAMPLLPAAAVVHAKPTPVTAQRRKGRVDLGSDEPMWIPGAETRMQTDVWLCERRLAGKLTPEAK